MFGYKYAIGPSVSTRVTQRFCDLSSGYRECPECVTSCAVCNRAVAVSIASQLCILMLVCLPAHGRRQFIRRPQTAN